MSTEKTVCLYCKKIIKEELEVKDFAKYAPFCSSRCKQLDLGKWLSGEYTIAGESVHKDTDLDLLDTDNKVNNIDN